MGHHQRARAAGPHPRRAATAAHLAAILLAAAGHASALDVSEQDAVSGAFARDALLRLESSRVATAESTVLSASTRPNPVATVSREGLTTAGDRSFETSFGLEQSIDLSGRRGLEREAAVHRLAAVRADVRDARRRLEAEVRSAFARTLHAESALAAYLASLARLDELQRQAGQLVEGGEASGYDARRLARELATVRTRASAVEADLAAAREILGGHAGAEAPGDVRAIGTLLPDPPPPLDALQAALAQRPDLESLLALGDAHARDGRTGERAWLPDVTVGVGQKRIENAMRSHDQLMLSLAIPLPLFDRGQARAAHGASLAAAARAEHELLLARLRAELNGQWQQAARLRSAALAQAGDGLVEARQLAEVAAAAYRGGEGGILELLDAERTLLESALLGLDLSLRARLARVELDLIAGVPTHD